MEKLIILIGLLFFTFQAYSQKYCTVYEDSGKSGMGKAYYLNNGAINDEILKDENGKNFKNMAAVLNYMDSMGFEYETAFTRTRGRDLNYPTIIFSRNDDKSWTVKQGRIVTNSL
jgi:hypothetical protein